MSPDTRSSSQIRSETDPAAADPRLRGRTYAIPFDRVWRTALDQVNETRGWTLVHADDLAGIIRCECRIPVLGAIDDLFVRIHLDEHAQTRLDLVSKARERRYDLGIDTRRIARFVDRLDRRMKVRSEQILDPTLSPTWTS